MALYSRFKKMQFWKKSINKYEIKMNCFKYHVLITNKPCTFGTTINWGSPANANDINSEKNRDVVERMHPATTSRKLWVRFFKRLPFYSDIQVNWSGLTNSFDLSGENEWEWRKTGHYKYAKSRCGCQFEATNCAEESSLEHSTDKVDTVMFSLSTLRFSLFENYERNRKKKTSSLFWRCVCVCVCLCVCVWG